jgi:hypothetical protein
MEKKYLRTYAMGLLSFFLISIPGFSSIADSQGIERPEYVSGEILVKFKPDVKIRDITLLKK